MPGDYDVVVEPGALDRLPSLLAEAAPAHRYAIIADTTVAGLYGERVRSGVEAAGTRADLFTFPAGEAHKTREHWAELTDALLEAGMGRDGAVIALGGGVTGDLAGFVAATFMRGVSLVQVPTSLLAMVDASVGGKTGVDVPGGKNLVGAFHPPRLVVADPTLLATLPDTELRAGLAEAVKHGAIADPEYLGAIRDGAGRLLRADPAALAAVVQRSVEIKAGFVAADPYEQGARKALNFGHTIGHAIEALTGYAVPHGYAVAIGMVAEAEIGEAIGLTAAGTAGELRAALASLGLPTDLPPEVDPAAAVEWATRDKKVRRGRTRYTLLARIGEVARAPEGDWSIPVDDDIVVATLSGAIA